MKNKLVYFLGVVLSLLLINQVNGQFAKSHLVKFKNRYNLLLEIDSSSSVNRYSVDCFAKPVTLLPINIKLQLIDELLTYEKDTSTCVLPVRKLHPLSTQIDEPTAKKYRIQIEALVLINLLAFGSDVFIYSPYPVLQCIDSGKEIDFDQNTISRVFGVYKNWFNKIKATGGENFTFPDINNEGVKWFGVGVSSRIYPTMGEWSSNFNCIEIE